MQPFDSRREHPLKAAARTFAERGFHRTSMRDLSRASGMSLAGMYYYVKGKEDLLFQIQNACFQQFMAGASSAVAGGARPTERLAAFIRHHVTLFASHMAEMKVLSHETESLTGEAHEEVRGLKRRPRGPAHCCVQALLVRPQGTGKGGRALGRHLPPVPERLRFRASTGLPRRRAVG